MNNILLFICGLVVTLMCGMGVLVYMVHLGYKHENETKVLKEKKIKEIEAKVDADLGAIKNDPNVESFVEIPSVS